MEQHEHRGALKIHFAVCKIGVTYTITDVLRIFVDMQSCISVQQIMIGLYFIVGII